MKITHFERTAVRVPFVDNILSTDEEWHLRPGYPENLNIVFEDPFPKENYLDYRRLREESSVEVTMHLQNPAHVIEAVYLEAVDGINVAPSDWGFLDMARIAEV